MLTIHLRQPYTTRPQAAAVASRRYSLRIFYCSYLVCRHQVRLDGQPMFERFLLVYRSRLMDEHCGSYVSYCAP